MSKKEKRHTKSAVSSVSEKWHSASAELSWTQYRRLMAVEDEKARKFYEEEAV